MGKKKNNKQRLPSQAGQANTPTQQPENRNLDDAVSSDLLTQIQQVDSWRSYKDGTNNLQTATDFQSFYQSHPTFFGNNQEQVYPTVPQGRNSNTWAPAPREQQVHSPQPLGQQIYPPVPQTMDLDALPSETGPSHFKPYRPLRVSNGTHERQLLDQAKTTPQNQPQSQTQDPRRYKPCQKLPNESSLTTAGADKPLPSIEKRRYKLRQRQPEQLAPYTAAHSAWEKAHPSVPTGRYPLRSQQTDQVAPFNESTASRLSLPFENSRKSPGRGWSPEVPSPVAPTPTEDYKRNAQLDPALRDVPARLLVILDLNGTLLVRPSKNNAKRIIVRPGVPAFLDYLFRNHVVMIFSSAKAENCAAMIEKFFRPDQRTVVAAVWARDKLGLTLAQYNAKVQVYKKLEPVWQDEGIQKRAGPGRVWDQSNTVLVDDSKLKALAQPHNLLQIPEFMNNEPKTIQARLDWWRGEEVIVQSVQQKLEELKWQIDVSRLIREWQTGKRQAPGVVDETIDQKALQIAEGRAPLPTLTPSISDREASIDPQQTKNHGSPPYPADQKDLPQYKPIEVEDDGVSSGDDGGVTLDDLEKDINRNLSLNTTTNHLDREQNRHQHNVGAAMAAGSAAITDRVQRRKAMGLAVESFQDFELQRELVRQAAKREYRKEPKARELAVASIEDVETSQKLQRKDLKKERKKARRQERRATERAASSGLILQA